MKIEHWHARSDPESKPFAWAHLLGVCRGISRDNADRAPGRNTYHCDTSRGDRKLFLHPVEARGPDPRQHLRYLKNGIIEPANQDSRVEEDIRILNLNAPRLKRAREVVFDAAWDRLKQVGFALGELRRLEQRQRIVPGTTVPEHADFVRYHLHKKIRSLGHTP